MPLSREPHLRGDLRRLITLIAAAITFFGLVLLAIIAYAGWSANQSAVERERTLLDNALNQSIARVLNEQKSVAWWDDAVVNITDDAIDLDFVDANFGIFLTETYAQDEVYILNAKDKPLYAWSNEARAAPSSFEKIRPAIEAADRRGPERKTVAEVSGPPRFVQRVSKQLPAAGRRSRGRPLGRTYHDGRRAPRRGRCPDHRAQRADGSAQGNPQPPR